jgi:hypothetical protein
VRLLVIHAPPAVLAAERALSECLALALAWLGTVPFSVRVGALVCCRMRWCTSLEH